MLLPQPFVERMHRLCGGEAEAFFASLEKESPVSIRINKEKISSLLDYSSVPWCKTGYYLPQRLHFTFDPLFHAGGYYVQEASSMFLEQVVKQYVTDPVRCLDLCAAPGGKTTHLLSLLPEKSLLVSNEVIRSRSVILAENVAKWGRADVIVTNNDPESIGQLTHFFDLVVADVPCSGEGMFRKDADSIGEWSESNVELCASRQRRIIHDIWDGLAPGGILVYSTCTYNTKENEENIEYICKQFGAEVLSVNCLPEWGVVGALSGDLPVYRFFPHNLSGEGFFMAVIRKPEGQVRQELRINKGKKRGKKVEKPEEQVKGLVTDSSAFVFESIPKGVIAFPGVNGEVYSYLREKLQVISAGILLGEMKGKDFIPAQSLALSTCFNRSVYPTWNVDWTEAIRFLRKESLSPCADLPKGIVLITYKDIPLGFIKNLGNRTNNLYPNEWRIRSGYLPESPNVL